MKRFALLALAVSLSLAGARALDLTDAQRAKVDDLLSRMTLQEKIGQINQQHCDNATPEFMHLAAEGQVGSLLNVIDPAEVNKLQRAAVENSRLGIPLIFSRDVIHGFKTIFPIPLGQAATWNPALVEQGARIAADEASSVGIRWTFSPMVDVSRDGRWGRIAESYGEDTYLNTIMGVAIVKGYQGNDLSRPGTMAACMKHFVGYGASESGKDYNSTWIPEVQLRDVYLPPFKAGAEAGAATFMCSFNELCGIPASGNEWLLRDVLRDEWGFDGFVVSDWSSIQQMIPQGFSSDLRHAARLGIGAGVDMDMESYAYINHLKDLVEAGEVPVETIDNAVRNILNVKMALGLFDNPYVDMETANRFYLPSSLEAARSAAAESIVLLKNNGVLPLKNVGKVALVGPMADAPHDQAGTWVFDLEKEHCVTPLQAFCEKYGAENIIYYPGLSYSREYAEFDIPEEVKAADVILYFAGEEAVLSGEAHCRADISLPGSQSELLSQLKATGVPVVTIVMTGRPMTIADEVEASDAFLYAFHLGTMAGPACLDVISGTVNPSGKLPVSLPRMVGQLPLYYAHNNTGRPASDMLLINDIPLEAGQTSTGCTSFYLDAGDGPAFPFGYGLSYTSFEYSEPLVDTSCFPLRVECTVTNTGDLPGAEVAQLYLRDPVASVVRPVKELKGFDKLMLRPGESRTVSFELSQDDLSFHNLRGEKIFEPGEFQVWVAGSSADGIPVNFNISE